MRTTSAERMRALRARRRRGGQIGKSREVGRCREPLRLEAAHLARRSRKALRCLAADDPTHCRIVAQTFSIVHVLISGETTKH